MYSPGKPGVRRMLAVIGLLAGCSQQDPLAAEADEAGGDERAGLDELVVDDVIPSQNISLPAGKFLEIDDISLTDDGLVAGVGPEGSRDTNLCSSYTNADFDTDDGDACPGGQITGAAGLLDNPNFPGPDPTAVETLGAEANYLDWADLDPADHILPFIDQDVKPSTLHVYANNDKDPGNVGDDIFSPGICIDESGSSPSKANFGITAFAANSAYFYLLNARETTNGNEAYHYFATKQAPAPAVVSCGDTWQWSLSDGDVHIELSYPSTAGLPFAVATVYVWEGGDATLDASDMIGEIGAGWVEVTDDVAYVAINVHSGGKAQPNEDDEKYFDGGPGPGVPSGLMVEVAIDIAAVFGDGCGLRRTISGISTASEGGNDDLKDFLSPVTVETGALVANLELAESCDEELNYEFEVVLEEDGGVETDVTADPDIDIEFVVDCTGTANDKTVTPSAADRASGTISIPVAANASCTVTANVDGVVGSDFESCDTTTSDSADVFPEIEATGSLDPDCSGNVAFDGTIRLKDVAGSAGVLVTDGSGSPNFDANWAFTVGGVANAHTANDLDDSFAAATSGTSSVAVSGTLTVSDLRARDLDGDPETDEETCPSVTAAPTTNALRPLSVELVPLDGDDTCEPDGNGDISVVDFNAVVKGGSGSWIVDWTLADDADLDANDAAAGTCASIEDAASGNNADVVDANQDYTQACAFDIGTDYCANGRVSLLVTDTNTECGNASDYIDAERTSSIDVTPDPAP